MSLFKMDSLHLAETNYSVGDLHADRLIPQMTEKERTYALYLTLASWAGFPILNDQVSRESGAVHKFLSTFFKSTPVEKLNAALYEKDGPLFYLLEFAGQFYGNGGNFTGMGDRKIIPRVTRSELEQLVKGNSELEQLLAACADGMYSLDGDILGWGPKGVTAYYDPLDFTEEEAKAVSSLLEKSNIGVENTTIVRETERYNVRLACVEVDDTGRKIGELNGKPVVVTKGRWSEQCKQIVKWLELAKKYSANEMQDKMLEALIKHFVSGDIADHKKYSEYWVQDIDPRVEMHHGFIETYRDPSGVRAEFEAFVACVDAKESEVLHDLVKASDVILGLMPYPKQYERSTFNPPSYNALNILTFCCSGMPIGINIPNYTDITETIGFKNVTLSNVVEASVSQMGKFPFLSEEDGKLVRENFASVDNFGTAAHELYGHGSGKQFTKEDVEGDKIPDLLNEGQFVHTYYEEGQTERTQFGGLYSAFEECRAETSALYLSFFDSALDIWQVDKSPEARKQFQYISTLVMLNAAIKGSIYYSPEAHEWKQAHARARYAILKACEIWGDGAVEIKDVEGECPFRLCVDINKLDGVKKAVTTLLKHLNHYRSANLPDLAQKLMTDLTTLDARALEIRAAATTLKVPRGVMCGAVVSKSDKGLELVPPADGRAPNLVDFVLGTVRTIELSGQA